MRQEPKNSVNALEDGIETETTTFYRALDRLVEEYVKQQTAFKYEAWKPGGQDTPRRGEHYETVIELTYRFDFRKSAFFIQTDLQYIIQPGGTAHLNNALVLGCPVRDQLLSDRSADDWNRREGVQGNLHEPTRQEFAPD